MFMYTSSILGVKKMMLLIIKLLLLQHVLMLFSSQAVILEEKQSLMRFMWMTPIQVFSLLQDESNCGSQQEGCNRYITNNIKTSNKPFTVTEMQLNQIKIALNNYYKYFIINKLSYSAKSSKAATNSDLFYLFQQQNDINFKRCIKNSPNISK